MEDLQRRDEGETAVGVKLVCAVFSCDQGSDHHMEHPKWSI